MTFFFFLFFSFFLSFSSAHLFSFPPSLSLSFFPFLSHKPVSFTQKKEHVGGAMVETTGLRFAPSLLSVMVSAFEGRAEGVNFEPRLIYIQPMGANAQPQGVNVQVRRFFFRSCLFSSLFFFLSGAVAAIKRKKGGKTLTRWCCFAHFPLFLSPSFADPSLSSDNNSQLFPLLAGAHLHRSHGRQRPAPGGQHPGAWFFFSVCLCFFFFFAFTSLSLSLTHTHTFSSYPSSRFIFVEPNHNINSPSSTP